MQRKRASSARGGQRYAAEPGEFPSPIPRYEWPGRIVMMIGCAMSLSDVALLIVLELG